MKSRHRTLSYASKKTTITMHSVIYFPKGIHQINSKPVYSMHSFRYVLVYAKSELKEFTHITLAFKIMYILRGILTKFIFYFNFNSIDSL